jgi:hypothetical protein
MPGTAGAGPASGASASSGAENMWLGIAGPNSS